MGMGFTNRAIFHMDRWLHSAYEHKYGSRVGGCNSRNANRDQTLVQPEDLMPKEDSWQKPAEAVLAAKMLYLVVVVGITRTVMTVVRHVDVRSPYFLMSVKLSIYVISVFVIYQLSKGKNWARWSLVAIFTICIPLAILPIFDSFSHSPVHSLLGLLQLALFVYSFVLLFCKKASTWFKQEKGS